jgi:hypothetical protein
MEGAVAMESSDAGFETFESFDEVEVSGVDTDEDWTADVPEPKAKDEGLKVLDDTDVDMDGDVVKEKEKKVAKKEEKEEDDSEDDDKPLIENDPNDIKQDKNSKKLRMRMSDGELYNIDSESTFKVKVDGEMQEVPVQELINNYSGKTAWDKKFTEIGKEKKTLEFEKSQIQSQKNKLIQAVNSALGPIKDPAKNPMDSLLYLVEMTGEDPYTAYRRIMESNLEELGSLMDMTETERELYFHKKKDELHGKVQKQRQAKMDEETSLTRTTQHIDSLRQAKNVSENDFVDASEELESIYKDSGLDVESITAEVVVDYASLKPHIAAVKELIAPFEENISEAKYGDVVAELSRSLRDGKADKAAILELLKRNFSVEEDVKELNTKVYQKGQKAPKKVELKDKGSDGFESFADWE